MSNKTVDDNYKDTLNLPNTGFPMKANLAEREPVILKQWQSLGLYEKIQNDHSGAEKFILHSGPPYANGHIHLGHAVNYTLKDMVVKSKVLSGFYAPFVPGWDCHGLPVELNVEKQIGKPGDKVDAKTFRLKCREYVAKQVEAQKSALIRLGVLADWEKPYLTSDFQYEADIVRSVARIVEQGYLHKGYKPVHWCIDCASALAEAEVEYQDKTSPAIDVGFQVIDNESLPFQSASAYMTQPITVLIWTTTPWTLPANEAVAVHPTHSYVLLEIEVDQQKKLLIMAAELVAAEIKRLGVEKYQILSSCEGKALEGIKLFHPFYDRQVPVVLGDHVTLDAGTGCVHTAPAHGQDDFVLGEKYRLPLDNPVGSNGCFVPGTPLLAGEHVFKANSKIIDILKERNKLWHEEKIQHSYPHCWRHKTPLIFRATQQWFIGMDQKALRESAVAAIRGVKWIPTWGQARIEAMIEGRPDWCISRQRTWGVPLCLFLHKITGNPHPNTSVLMEKAAKKFETAGIDAWYDISIEEFLGEEAKDYEKSTDILDVWFDSGVSHACVLKRRPELSFPADLYLEGSDQHRGWFQSSLLTAVAMEGQAPYRQVLTHGFTVDAEGHKMSKSLGNTVAPEKVFNTLGADVLRLWVSSTDYRSEMAVSEEILKRTSDTYRRIRNTARFLLANLNGFDLDHLVHPENLLALDRWIINRAKQLQIEIKQAYEKYEFHIVYQKLHHFCSIDLGSFYLDVIKDRQYTGKKEGIPRRSAQTALYHIAEALVRWMAPILSFTAEEIWQYLPGQRKESVFLSNWYEKFPEWTTDAVMNDAFWQRILEIRAVVNKALEEARAEGLIGSSLEADLTLYCDSETAAVLSQLKNELRFVLITSEAEILSTDKRDAQAKPTALEDVWLWVKSSENAKCVRCWHRRPEVDQNKQFPGLCERCIENVEGLGEKRYYA